jgi:predicted negative regulator of RcsB-dependent stress response
LVQHISRRELKKDEVRETFAQGIGAILSHEQFALYLLIALAVVAAGVFGWREYSERQTVKSSAAFDDAMKVFQAPVGAPTAPGEVTYSDANKKFTQAEKQFSDLASKYPHTRAGELARYYAALSLEKVGKDQDAEKWLQGVITSSDPEIKAMAQFELAAVDDRIGRSDQALKLYNELLAKPTVLVPRPVIMLALAGHFSAKDPAQAAKLYSQIKSDYPNTPIAEQADQGLALLPNKS